MAAPVITVTTVSKNRISAVAGSDQADVSFTSDKPVIQWEARADGAGLGQGLLVGQAATIPQTWDTLDAKAYSWDAFDALGFIFDQVDKQVVATAGQAQTFAVENEELTQGDKTYRINIYAQNPGGEWTPYV